LPAEGFDEARGAAIDHAEGERSVGKIFEAFFNRQKRGMTILRVFGSGSGHLLYDRALFSSRMASSRLRTSWFTRRSTRTRVLLH